MSTSTASEIKFGLIGLDTSHVVVFSDEFNNPDAEHSIAGAKVVAAWPGGSPDLPPSISRVEGFTKDVSEKYGVKILDSIEAVCEASDAILLSSVDGRVHLDQFKKIAPFGKPVFIDKPFALTTADAKAIFALAEEHKVPIFSSSSLRFTGAITRVVTPEAKPLILGADIHGPVALEPTNPGFFWYGIHIVEMLYSIMGTGCRSVRAVHNENFELVTAVWADGRMGSLHGNRTGNYEYHGLVHFEKNSVHVNAQTETKGFFSCLGDALMEFFQTGQPPVSAEETLELIRFIEAVNESRDNDGREVLL